MSRRMVSFGPAAAREAAAAGAAAARPRGWGDVEYKRVSFAGSKRHK